MIHSLQFHFQHLSILKNGLKQNIFAQLFRLHVKGLLIATWHEVPRLSDCQAPWIVHRKVRNPIAVTLQDRAGGRTFLIDSNRSAVRVYGPIGD